VSSARAIVLSGASTGIGAAAAAALAHAGFVVFAGVRSDADAERAAAAHANIRPLRLDVTDSASIVAAAQQVTASGLALSGLVNNAGIAVAGPLEFLPLDEVRRAFEVNVFGAIAVTQAFLPQLRATRGRVVFVGSSSGRLSIPFVAPYSASKFALRAIADAFRMELHAAGIAVVLVEPGSVKTPIWQKGRDGRAALDAMLPPGALAMYGGALDALFRGTEYEERTGLPVERVARAIVEAVTSRSPRANELLGFPARAGSLLALLPARFRERILLRTMRIP
jgi:NAD(P)-dependent dehydrogenase (short-subunit alcohol dehydrogenase family)